jgi:hypothetical protein
MLISPHRRPLLIALALVGATVLFSGCGPTDSELMQTSKVSSSSPVSNVLGDDNVLGTDPSITPAAMTTLDDPVLGEADSVPGLEGDDPFAAAATDWDDHEGSMGGLSTIDDSMDDAPMPVGYDGGYGGYDDSVGSLSVASVGAGPAMMDAGFDDPGVADAGVADAGFEDPGVGAAGVMDVGMDPAVDPSVGIDAGVGIDPSVGGIDF